MSKLTTLQRKQLKSRSFAEPGKRAYPIPDKSHARNALARVSQFGSPMEKARVRAAVHRKFPSIGKRRMVPLSSLLKAKDTKATSQPLFTTDLH